MRLLHKVPKATLLRKQNCVQKNLLVPLVFPPQAGSKSHRRVLETGEFAGYLQTERLPQPLPLLALSRRGLQVLAASLPCHLLLDQLPRNTH